MVAEAAVAAEVAEVASEEAEEETRLHSATFPESEKEQVQSSRETEMNVLAVAADSKEAAEALVAHAFKG